MRIVSLLSAAFEYKSLLASTLVVERTPQEIRLHILKLEIRTDKNNIIGTQHMELLTVLLAVQDSSIGDLVTHSLSE